MVVTNNPYNARIIDVPLAVGKLRLKYSPRSTVKIYPALKRKHDNGQFLRISHDPKSTEHTLIRGSDGGIMVYHVPATYLWQQGVQTDLYDTIERIRVKSLRQYKGAYREEAVSRHYCLGDVTGINQQSVPNTSKTESPPSNSSKRVKLCGRKPPKSFERCPLQSGKD